MDKSPFSKPEPPPQPNGVRCPKCGSRNWHVGTFNVGWGTGKIYACFDCRHWCHQYRGESELYPEIPYKDMRVAGSVEPGYREVDINAL
jgi:hypothetical protein